MRHAVQNNKKYMVLSWATMELLQQDCFPMHHADQIKKGARWLCGFIHASIYVLFLNLIIMEPAAYHVTYNGSACPARPCNFNVNVFIGIRKFTTSI